MFDNTQNEEIGNNPTRSRDHNRKLILDLLRQHGQLGRKELAQMSQLSAPAVGNILDTLLENQWIVNTGKLRQGRGQPALQFAINPHGAYTIGFEIGVRGIYSVALDLGGKPIARRFSELNTTHWQPCSALLLAEQKRFAALASGELLGIGLVMPTPVMSDKYDPTTLPLADKPPIAWFEQQFNAPVFIENDANAAALAESLFGKALRLRDFAMLYFGEGLGLGIIHGGRLFRGGFGNAGEIGHIPIVPLGKPCYCGQKGCLERYVSRHALSEHLGQALYQGSVQQLWDMGDKRLIEWIIQSGDRLSPIIALIENLLDPQTIIIGGQLPAAVINALISRIILGTSVATHKHRTLPRLIRGDTGVYTAALGAATLPFYDHITPFG